MKISTPFQCVPLKDVVYFQEGPGLRNWQYGASGIPFLNIRTLTDEGVINKSLCQFVKEEEFNNKYEHFLLDAGDYVVSSSGTLGKLAEVRPQDLPVMLNTSVIRFRPLETDKLDRVFLKWFIKSPLYIRQIEKASTGTAIKNYGPSHLKQMVIPLPPIAEQRRIAAILDKADAIRRKRQQAIQHTEELLRSVFLDMFGDPVINPKGWEIVAIESIAKKQKNSLAIGPFGSALKVCDYRDCGHPVIFVRDVKENSFNWISNVFLDDDKFKELKSHHVRPNDVVATKMGLPPCIASVYPKSMPIGVITADIIKVSVDVNKAIPSYVSAAINSSYCKYQVTLFTEGITRPKVTLRDFRNLKIPLPSLREQIRWDKFYEKQRSTLNGYLQNLEEQDYLFNSLLQRAFRGEL